MSVKCKKCENINDQHKLKFLLNQHKNWKNAALNMYLPV